MRTESFRRRARRQLPWLGLALAVQTPFAIAQEGADAAEAAGLDEMIVTGGLTPLRAEALGRSVTVVSSYELESRQIVYAADAMRALPGVSISRTGSFGGLTQVRLRGAEGRHTLVLVDGVDVGAPEQGEYDLSGLLAADIERIEVLRGPQSALFGSNTIGGVIAITTKRAAEPGATVATDVETGSDGTLGGNVALRYRAQRGDFSASAARRSTGGYDISRTPGGRRDGDENLTLNFRGGYQLADGVSVDGSLRYVDRTSDSDPQSFAATTREEIVFDRNDFREREELFGSLQLRADALGGRSQNWARFSFSELDGRGYTDGVQGSDNSSDRRTGQIRSAWALDAPTVGAAAHTWSAAFDWDRESYRANDPNLVGDPSQLERQARTRRGIAMEYRGRFLEDVNLQLGLRHDFNDGFRDFTTWSTALSYNLPLSDTRLRASVATGVQNPSLISQFGFTPGSFIGNPDLEPEQSRGWDVGIEQTILGGRGLVDVVYFSGNLTDKIDPGFDPDAGLSTSVNSPGRSTRRGVEASAALDFTARLGVDLRYTYTHARTPTGLPEVRRPYHDVGLNIDYVLPDDRTTVTTSAQFVRGLTDLDFRNVDWSLPTPRVRLDDYALINLALGYRVSDRVQARARINNLFNTRYEEILGFGAQGRTAYLGLRMDW